MKTFALGLAAGAVLMACLAAAEGTAAPTPEPTPTIEMQEVYGLTDVSTEPVDLDRGNYEVEVIPTPTPPVYDTHENDPPVEGEVNPPTCEDQGLITAEDLSCVDPSFYEEPLPPTDIGWHSMDQGVLICGPGAKPAIDYNEHTGWGWWAYCEPALVD